MSEIRCACRTNLDGFDRVEWPRWLAAVPRVGERVAAKSGIALTVVSVTHHGYEHGDLGVWVELELSTPSMHQIPRVTP